VVAVFEQNSTRAIERLSTESYDLVVSDQRMPGPSGVEVLEAAARHLPFSHRILLTGHADLETAMAAVNRGQVSGLLTKPWDARHLRDVLEGEARSAAFTRLARAQTGVGAVQQTIDALIAAIEAKDPYTRGHSELVSSFSCAIAERAGLSSEDLEAVRIGSLLHDCGKIGIPERILNKPGFLTDAEYALLKRHPELGFRIVTPVSLFSDPVRDVVLHHHERWDGMGYPEGLSQEEILLGTRIVSVADACEAMTAPRVHRPPRPLSFVLEELGRQAGHQFDPEIAKLGTALIEDGTFSVLRAGVHIVPQEASLDSTIDEPNDDQKTRLGESNSIRSDQNAASNQ